MVLVRSPDGDLEEASACTLIAAIDAFGGAAEGAEGNVSYEAQVVVARGNQHQAVWWKRRVVGFFELLTERRKATLRLDGTKLTVTSIDREPLIWKVENIRAMQISSTSIQLNIRGVGLYQMEFLSDSPKRWEDLLKAALRRVHAALGREVMEFQPQIITRAQS